MSKPFALSSTFLSLASRVVLAGVFVGSISAAGLSAEPRDGDVESDAQISVSHTRGYGEPARSQRESADGDVESEYAPNRKWTQPQRRETPAQPVPAPASPLPPPIAAPAPSPSQDLRHDSSRWLPAVVHVNDSNYQAELGHYSGLVLIDFYSKLCAPCMKTSPIVDRWGEEFRGQVKVVKIESEKSPRLVERFKVTGLPCLVMLNGGQEVNRETGIPPTDLLKRWVQAQK